MSNKNKPILSSDEEREDKMSDREIDRMIELLVKWKMEDINYGECSELRELRYRFSDTIEKYWWMW